MDHLLVPVSQVLNLALVNLAMGHEVLHEVESMEVAYFAVVNPEVACLRRRPQSAAQQELEAE